MKNYIKLINNAHDKLQKIINNAEENLKDKIEFDFFIMHQPSDGYVVVHKECMHNAPLSLCLLVIKEKGILSYDDYIKYAI